MMSNQSKIMDLEYDHVELNKPDMKNEPLQQKVVNDHHEANDAMLIKKQSKDETVEVLNEMKTSMLQTLNDLVQTYLPMQEKKKFDPLEFYEKIKKDQKYGLNQSWIQDFAVMACPATSFLERFSIQGEFFENYS